MTPRARVLAILSGEQPDQVPWFGDLDYWTCSQVKRGLRPEGFIRSEEYIEWHRELGVGLYLQGFHPYQEHVDQCDVRVWDEVHTRYGEIGTLYGTLRERWQWLPETFSESPVERLVESISDLRTYQYYVQHTRLESDFEFAGTRAGQIGEQGTLVTYTPRTPFIQLLSIDAGIEAIVTIQMEDAGALTETISVMVENKPRLYGLLPPDGLERRVVRVRELVDEYDVY